MIYANYKIGAITNSCGPSIIALKKTAEKFEVSFETVPYEYIPLTGFATSEYIKSLLKFDVVYYRTGFRDTAIYELFELLQKNNIAVINAGTKFPSSHRKIKQALIADRYNITHPKSIYLRDFDYSTAARLLGDTFVVKPDYGSKGDEVNIISSQAELDTFSLTKKKEHYIYQQLIKDSSEYRVYTIDGIGVASYKKVRGVGEFRANLHTGGSMEPTEPTLKKDLLAFGAHVSRCFGADIAGVDILYKDGEFIFLELNWQPGWESLDELTGTDFSKNTIQYLLARAHKAQPWWKRLLD